MTKDNLDISNQPFARKPETEAEAEARRAKNKPVDMSGGLKVVEPLNTKITAAIAKDFVDKGRKAQQAADAVIATATAKPPKKAAKYDPTKDAGGDAAMARAASKTPTKKAATKKAATKKLSPTLAKAVRERDALNAKAAEAKSAKSTGSAKPAKKKSAEPRRSNGKYDWDKAEADAKAGKLPEFPPFGSYRAHNQMFWDMARKKDLAGIQKKQGEHEHNAAQANMHRFADLLKVYVRKVK